MTRSLLLAGAVAALATSSCRTTSRGPAVPLVSDADLGRLGPAEMGPVQSARADLATAQDGVARARLRVEDAKHEKEFASADITQAQAEGQRADAATRSAEAAGDRALLARASEQHRVAALHAQAAQARVDYASKLVAARQADVQAAEARVRLGEWQVERAKLTALQQAGVPAASKYDPTPIDRSVAESASAVAAADAKGRELDGAAVAAANRWRSLQEQYQASARGAAGTG